MTKASAKHSPYQIMEDALLLVGSFAKLGTTIVSHKIQSSTESANSFVHSKVDLTDIDAKLSDAATGIENASDYALHTDVRQMVDDAGSFARKHPITSLVTVVALGAVVARLMQSRPEEAMPVATRSDTPKPQTLSKKRKSSAKSRGKANGSIQANG